MNGWKTYAAAAITIVFAITGAIKGVHDWNHAVQLIMEALMVAGLRHGISNTK